LKQGKEREKRKIKEGFVTDIPNFKGETKGCKRKKNNTKKNKRKEIAKSNENKIYKKKKRIL
jgi:hypothetical protein